jgi:hypothetical protein
MVIELRHTNPNASGTIREEGINFLSPNTSARGRITFYPSDTFNVRNYLAFFTPSGSGSNAERMRIANDGEVHIGIADAGAFALQVSGSIYATQDAYIYANIRAGRGAGNVSSNTTFGASALNANTTGNNIVAVGSGALQSNTSGSLLTAVGEGSLNANTTGNGSTAVGRQVLYKNTTGEDNTAIGSYWNDLPPMLENTTGSFNTAVGGGSISRATTASSNTAVGYRSLNNITTGGLNTALGEFAGAFLNAGGSNATSTNSIYIGRDTRASANGNTNEIVLGHNGRGNGSNTTTIGNTSTVGTYFPAGEMYIGTTTDAGAYALQVAGSIYNTTGAVLAASSGNVGIGTTSPAYKLVVRQATQGVLAEFRTIDGTDNPGLNIETNASGTMLMQVYSAGNTKTLQFGTNSTERLRIHENGGLKFVGQSAAPNAEAGTVYYDTDDNKLKVYNGTTWVDLH